MGHCGRHLSEDGQHYDLLMPSPNDPTSVVHLFGVPKVRDSLEMEIPCSTLWGPRTVRAPSEFEHLQKCCDFSIKATTWPQGRGP